MANDVVVLTHVKIKLKQMVETNAKLTEEANQLNKHMAQVIILFQCMIANCDGMYWNPYTFLFKQTAQTGRDRDEGRAVKGFQRVPESKQQSGLDE